jgi:hypothetical protein
MFHDFLACYLESVEYQQYCDHHQQCCCDHHPPPRGALILD